MLRGFKTLLESEDLILNCNEILPSPKKDNIPT
jgi:hypothetical protein